MGTGRWMLGPIGWRIEPVGATAEEVAAEDEEEEDETATRSHEGHMVSVVGGFMCM
jgi:hypothetical protein